MYAGDYSDKVPPINNTGGGSGATFVVSALATNIVDAVNTYLKLQVNLPSIWVCPNRLNTPAPGLPTYNGTSQMYIGYCYFGGMNLWNPKISPTGASYSPVKLTTAKSWWALGADTIMKLGATTPGTGTWAGQASAGGAYAFEYANIPPHTAAGGNPAGGNEVFSDGSANWCKFETMYRFNKYDSAIGNDLDSYWYQNTQDFDIALTLKLPNLK
jgi:hypothetical protein